VHAESFYNRNTKLFIVEDWSLRRPLMMFIEKPVMAVALFLACDRDRTYMKAPKGPMVPKESSAAFFRLKKGHRRGSRARSKLSLSEGCQKGRRMNDTQTFEGLVGRRMEHNGAFANYLIYRHEY